MNNLLDFRKASKISKVLVIALSFLLLVFLALIFLYIKNSSQTSSESERNSETNYDQFVSEKYGYTFKYPDSWDIEIIQLKKGESYIEEPYEYTVENKNGETVIETLYKHTIISSYSDTEVIILTKDGEWSLEIVVGEYIDKSCGGETGFGTVGENYKILEIDDKYRIARYRFEEGKYRIITDVKDRYPVVQFYQALFEETLDNGTDVYYLPFCITFSDIPLTLGIEIVSDLFTESNMENGYKMDPAILSEMDEIVESISIDQDGEYFNYLK